MVHRHQHDVSLSLRRGQLQPMKPLQSVRSCSLCGRKMTENTVQLHFGEDDQKVVVQAVQLEGHSDETAHLFATWCLPVMAAAAQPHVLGRVEVGSGRNGTALPQSMRV